MASIDEIIADADVDAVFITTPTDMHSDLIEQAAVAGKAIFCEKPIDLSVERVRRCLAVVDEHGARLMVGFNRRFDPNFRAARARVDAGEIGDVEMVSITSRDPGPPPLEYMARSGGLFRDMTIHDFDMARFLLGEEPVSVSAVGSVFVDPAIGGVPDIDSAAVTLVTATGKIAQISNSRRTSYGYDQRIEVHGSQGMVRAENIHETTVEVAGSHGFHAGAADELLHRALHDRRTTPRWRRSCRRSPPASHPSPTARPGLQALVLAEAAVRSDAERRTVDVAEI